MMTKAKPLPPLELVQQLLDYDPKLGSFCWKDNRGNKGCMGKPAGSIQRGYVNIYINGKDYRAHRLAWLLETGADPAENQIDHINGNKSDNRFTNLRLATNSENACNRTTSSRNTSGFKGVSYSRRKKAWRADVRKNGVNHHIGHFPTPELAHMAYCKAAAELHGDFARAA
jgi:hypothetical protein